MSVKLPHLIYFLTTKVCAFYKSPLKRGRRGTHFLMRETNVSLMREKRV